MEYEIYVKSHCEASDYEDYCEAKTIEEASEIFANRMNKLSTSIDYENDKVYGGDWSPKDLIKYIQQI